MRRPSPAIVGDVKCSRRALFGSKRKEKTGSLADWPQKSCHRRMQSYLSNLTISAMTWIRKQRQQLVSLSSIGSYSILTYLHCLFFSTRMSFLLQGRLEPTAAAAIVTKTTTSSLSSAAGLIVYQSSPASREFDLVCVLKQHHRNTKMRKIVSTQK
jgi:hypothetical protein